MTAFDGGTGAVVTQYAYQLPRIPVDAAPGAPFGPDNGLPDLLALSDTRFLALERAFASGVGNTIRLVVTEAGPGTTDVSRFASLLTADYTPMSRALLLEMPITYEGVTMDTFEGLAWGHTLTNGHRTLVLATDINFSATQTNKFMVFEVVPTAPIPEPGTFALLGVGLGLLRLLTRRRA